MKSSTILGSWKCSLLVLGLAMAGILWLNAEMNEIFSHKHMCPVEGINVSYSK
jgi:hypothetical protein